MKFLTLLGSFLLLTSTYGQYNLDSISHVDYQSLHATELNDIWGYVDETNIEYALVGARKGTTVDSLQDPANPIEVFWEPGMESIWRDLKTWNNHAYVTTEAENGLLIIDLNPLPASTSLPVNYYNGTITGPWSSAHNLYIDSNGFAYIFGANRGNGGVIILDLNTDPMNPVEVGVFDNWYVHDGFVRNDTMFLAHIDQGFLSLVDVTDKANPILLGTKTTPSNFTHNIWPRADGKVAFTTDEVSGAFLAAYDVSDPSNIVELDRIQSSPGYGIIPHNVHVKGNFIITSYYADGVTIHDVTHPSNMVQVGAYDTYPLQTSSFDGCWGVYPFLPSGLILATDITEGLFILNPTYVQAAYLEGNVIEDGTLLPLANVSVQIQANDQIDYSRTDGSYGTGILNSGTYTVTYTKVGYYPQSFTVNLTQGIITYQDVTLVPIPPFNLTVNVFEAGTMNPIQNVQLLLSAPLLNHTGITNGIGQEDFTLYYEDWYAITLAKWGYVTQCFDQFIDASTGTINIILEKGYHDEFTFDLGWIVNGSATSGMWERGIPNPTNSGSAPSDDAPADCGKNAYVTGNNPNLNPDVDDVDGGYTTLVSPPMDLTIYTDPHLNYQRWFYCMFGAPPNDTLKVIVSNGFLSVVVDQVGPDPSTFFKWNPKSVRLADHLAITSSMQVFFRVADFDPDVNITEAGIDYFYISNANVLGSDEKITEDLSIYPNPVENQIFVKGLIEDEQYTIFDFSGKQLRSGVVQMTAPKIELDNLQAGMYLLQINERSIKFIKH